MQKEKQLERETLSVMQTARALGLGQASTYLGIQRGDIPAIRIGRRIVVPKAALEKLLADPGRVAAERP